MKTKYDIHIEETRTGFEAVASYVNEDEEFYLKRRAKTRRRAISALRDAVAKRWDQNFHPETERRLAGLMVEIDKETAKR